MITFHRPIFHFIIASLLCTNAANAFDVMFKAEANKNQPRTQTIPSSASSTIITTFDLEMGTISSDGARVTTPAENYFRDSSSSSSNRISIDLPTEQSILQFDMKKTGSPNHWEGFSDEVSSGIRGALRGDLRGAPAYFLLAADGKSVTGTFEGPSGSHYTIRTQADGKIVVDMFTSYDMPQMIISPDDGNTKIATSMNVAQAADSGDSVDLMVVYTMKAMCFEAGLTSPCTNNATNRLPIENLIKLAVNNNNVAHTSTKTGVKMNLVHTYLAQGYTEPADQVAALNDLTKTSSQGYPKLDEVHSLRNTYGADLVMLVGTVGTGVAWVPSSPGSVLSEAMGFSYMNRSLVSVHVMAHELGHNFGCLHDRNNSDRQDAYAHGYQDPSKAFRTIMAYNCSGGGCPVQNFYSSPNFTYQGKPIGSSTENCTRKIQETRVTIANFRQHKGGGGVGGGSGLTDWQVCTSSSQCKNGCCSGRYSGGILKCTPLVGGYNPKICIKK